MDEKALESSKLRERRGKLRFPADDYSEMIVSDRGMRTAGTLYGRLPSNYPNSLASNLGALYRVFGEEFERLHKSLSDVGEDRFNNGSRAEYLYQTLGTLLFLGSNSAGSTDSDGVSLLTDTEYRDFLLKVRNSYFGGSRNDNIEASLQSILGVNVSIRELFQEARKSTSPYGLKDTHRLICDLDMETSSPGNAVGKLVQDIKFYTDLLRPAHSLLETRLVWKDSLGLSGGCNPTEFGVDPNGNSIRFQYDSTANDYLALITVTKDLAAEGTSWVTGTVASIAIDGRSITLASGDILVVSSLSTFYDKDTQGEFRIDLADLQVDDDIKYIGTQAPGAIHFLYTPAEVTADPLSIYDPTFILTPRYQEFAAKEMDAHGRFDLVDQHCTGAMLDRKVSDLLDPMYEDMRRDCNYPEAVPVFYQATATAGQFEFTLDPHPILNSSDELAGIDDVLVQVNGITVPDALLFMSPLEGTVLLDTPVSLGDVVKFTYRYSGRFPSELTFEKTWGYAGSYNSPVDPADVVAQASLISPSDVVKRLYWPYPILDPSAYGTNLDVQMDRFPMLDAAGNLATASNIEVKIDGVTVTGAVESIAPLLGHVRLNFLPPLGSKLEVLYHYTEKKRSYAMGIDDPSYTYDAFYGNQFPYELVTDQSALQDPLAPVAAYTQLLKIGYRYRAYSLANTSVLNSSDTLSTNSVPVPAKRGSIASAGGIVGQASLVYSPEHLTDTSKYIELSDEYLTNGLTPITQLHKGTPTFQKTFTDLGNFADDDQTAQEQSGLIEYAPLADYRANGHLFLYSDLHEFTSETGTDAPLSPLCDSRDISLAFRIEEEYYPNREMRLNDYLDFVERFDSLFMTSGHLKAINGSNIVKSLDKNWLQVPLGATLTVGSDKYTVVKQINYNTLALYPTFSGNSGEFSYEITVSEAPQVKVRLNEVTRRVVATLPSVSPYSVGYTTSLSPSFTPWIIETAFPDPDPDPYPRNFENVNYPVPSAPLLTSDIHSDSGEVDLLLSPAPAEKMVKWRNWDQDLIVAGMGLVAETPLSPMDDLGDFILVSYWDANALAIVQRTYTGTVVATSIYQADVPYASYPSALIDLRNDPGAEGGQDVTYAYWVTTVRQIRPDGLVDVTVLDEYRRIAT